MLELILIPTSDEIRVGDLVTNSYNNVHLINNEHDLKNAKDYIKSGDNTKLYVYIIDTKATINEGEIGISLNPEDYGYIQPIPIFKPQLELENIKWFKAILATNNSSSPLPQLSQQALKTIVENNGKLDEFDLNINIIKESTNCRNTECFIEHSLADIILINKQTTFLCEEKKVDFELLKSTIEGICYVTSIGRDENDNSIKNIELFFKMLSKSSTFAHKAHKELKRLNS